MSLETIAAPVPEPLRPVWDAEAHAADQWSEIYDSVYDSWQPCFRAYRERMAEVIYSCWYEGRGGRVLDAGCGTGSLLHLLTTRIPAHRLAGVDLSPKMVERSAARLKGIELCTTPFEEYVAAEPFDVVFFANSLRFMPDHRLVAERLAEVTRPGARVIVFETNPDWLYLNRWLSRRARLLNPRWLLWRFRSSHRIQRIGDAVATLPGLERSAPPTAAATAAAFSPRLQLRTHRTTFGVTRLFENVITDSRPVEQATRPVAHQRRSWAGTFIHLQDADHKFADRHPHGGGQLELVFDRDLR